jgi:hypothetical protein
MKTFLKAIVLIPAIVLAVGWALSNRQPVEVSTDVFQLGVTPYILGPMPLYGLVFAAMAAGVVLGGAMTWLSQGRYRKQASIQRLEAHKLRHEVERLSEAQTRASGSTAVVSR